jgi:hypothetical protein
MESGILQLLSQCYSVPLCIYIRYMRLYLFIYDLKEPKQYTAMLANKDAY